MNYKIYRKTYAQLIKIWHYTCEKWGEEQANKYIHELYNAIEKISSTPELWKKIKRDNIKNVFYYRHQKHFIFFKILSKESIGIISILHERMHLPEQLKKDL